MGARERIKNFNYPEFGVIEKEAGKNRFIMTVGQWITRTNAIGLIVKQKIILDYLRQFGKAKRTELKSILLDKPPSVLDIRQKRDKVKNNLQTLEKQGIIAPVGKTWKMSKPEKNKID